MGIFEDITEHKRTAEVLKEKNVIFNAFMEHSPIYVFFKDHNIRAMQLSRNFEKMLGMPLEAIVGKTMDELFPSDLAKSIMEDDKRILNEGKLVHVDEELDGHYYTTIKFPINLEDRPPMLAGFTIDITERKKTEEVLAFLAQFSVMEPGKGFFELLASYLAKNLGMDFVCIDRLEGDGLNARTVAVWCDGKFEDNVTYALKDTPCGEVVGKAVCCFPASVCQFFPRDEVITRTAGRELCWCHTLEPYGRAHRSDCGNQPQPPGKPETG